MNLVEVWCRAIRGSLGLFDHYFLVVNDLEYHLGCYAPGNVLPRGFSRGAHLVSIKTVCRLCFLKLVKDLKYREHKRLFAYYPLLNCESLVRGVSVQSLLALNFLGIPFLLWYGKFILAAIVLLLLLCTILAWSKFQYSRTTKTRCPHLKFD